MDKLTLINQGQGGEFRIDENGVMRFGDRGCVLDVTEIRKSILEEGHRSGLSIHPGATKMYHDLKKLFWWSGMKKEISEFVYACLVCQKSKIEHQKPSGLMEPLFVPEWKWMAFLWILCLGYRGQRRTVIPFGLLSTDWQSLLTLFR